MAESAQILYPGVAKNIKFSVAGETTTSLTVDLLNLDETIKTSGLTATLKEYGYLVENLTIDEIGEYMLRLNLPSSSSAYIGINVETDRIGQIITTQEELSQNIEQTKELVLNTLNYNQFKLFVRSNNFDYDDNYDNYIINYNNINYGQASVMIAGKKTGRFVTLTNRYLDNIIFAVGVYRNAITSGSVVTGVSNIVNPPILKFKIWENTGLSSSFDQTGVKFGDEIWSSEEIELVSNSIFVKRSGLLQNSNTSNYYYVDVYRNGQNIPKTISLFNGNYIVGYEVISGESVYLQDSSLNISGGIGYFGRALNGLDEPTAYYFHYYTPPYTILTYKPGDDNILNEIKNKTDQLNFNGDYVKADTEDNEVNVGKVKSVDVVTIEDFKADLTSVEEKLDKIKLRTDNMPQG